MTTPDDSSTPAPEEGFIARVSARMQQQQAPAAAPTPEPVVTPAAPPVAPVSTDPPVIEPEISEEVDEFGLPIDKPVAEEEPADDQDAPADPKAAHAFKSIRTELKSEKVARAAAEARLAEIESKLTEREAAAPELTELQTKVAEYEKLLSVTRLESSPAYIKTVEEPFQAVITRADEIAALYEIDNLELTKAIAIPDKKERAAALKDLLAGVDDDDRLEVRELAREVEKISAKQAELIANADGALAELEAEAARSEASKVAARAVERKETVSKVIPHMAKRIPSFAPQIEALAASLADTDLSARNTTRQVFDAAAGELLPVVIADRNKTLKMLQDALEENEKLRRATPGSGGGGGGGGGGGSGPTAGETFSERVAKRFSGAA